MRKIDIVVIASFIFMIFGLTFMTYSFINADARPPINEQIKEQGLEEFQLFDDGVTYMVKSESGMLYEVTGVYLVVDEEIFDCIPNGYHTNQFMNPLCFEIILRHELDRRGL